MTAYPSFVRAKLNLPEEIFSYAQIKARPRTSFVGWLEGFDNKLLYRCFAFRKHKGKALEIMEIARSIYKESRYVRNLYYTQLGGWNAVYEKEDKWSSSDGYAFVIVTKDSHDRWEEYPLQYACAPAQAIVLNPEYLQSTQQWKYSGYQASCGDLFAYLDFYLEEPKVEYLGKLGIKPCKSYISLLKKDPGFARFIGKNSEQLKYHGPSIVLAAYKEKVSFEAEESAARIRWQARRTLPVSVIRKMPFTEIVRYLKKEKADAASYIDYINACVCLEEKVTEKILFPHPFGRMHDLKINQYASKKAKEDAAKKKALGKKFKSACCLFSAYEATTSDFLLFAPKNLSELFREGMILHHCVGRMGYDIKMADKKTAIFFIRKKDDPSTPYFTVEYDPYAHKVVQCRGMGNCNPEPAISTFLEEWKLMANRVDAKLFNAKKA